MNQQEQNAYNQLTGRTLEAEKHWQEFRPKMYKELKQSESLYQALLLAQEQTEHDLNQLEESGLEEWEAWEVIRDRYLFLPEEPGTTPEAPQSPIQELISEAQSLHQEALDHLESLELKNQLNDLQDN